MKYIHTQDKRPLLQINPSLNRIQSSFKKSMFQFVKEFMTLLQKSVQAKCAGYNYAYLYVFLNMFLGNFKFYKLNFILRK